MLILVKRYESMFYKNQPYMKKWTQRETISLISRLFLPIFDRSPSPWGGFFLRRRYESGGAERGWGSLLSLVHESEPIQRYDDVADEWDDERHHEIRGISDHTHEQETAAANGRHHQHR